MVEDAHKARMQLRRARKDLQDLWLERDELAKLAGQAMQVRGCASLEPLENIVPCEEVWPSDHERWLPKSGRFVQDLLENITCS